MNVGGDIDDKVRESSNAPCNLSASISAEWRKRRARNASVLGGAVDESDVYRALVYVQIAFVVCNLGGVAAAHVTGRAAIVRAVKENCGFANEYRHFPVCNKSISADINQVEYAAAVAAITDVAAAVVAAGDAGRELAKCLDVNEVLLPRPPPIKISIKSNKAPTVTRCGKSCAQIFIEFILLKGSISVQV
jgi:hypothetical protein